MPADKSLADQFAKSFGSAIDDIRSKVEEATWGRAVTDKDTAPAWPEAEAKPEHVMESQLQQPDKTPEQDKEQDRDLER